MKPIMAIWKSKLLLLIAFVLCWESVVALFYEGTRNSYARYEEWNTTTNGTLKFEFKTQRSDALLLYTGGAGMNFLEIRLEQARLQLRFRIKYKARSMYVGTNLNDNEWHEVTLMQGKQYCTINLDGEQISGSIPEEQTSPIRNEDLFFGGVPSMSNMAAASLSRPEVALLPHFEGHIRNLKYLVSDRPKRWYRPELLVSSGIIQDPTDLCGSNDWCLNHGLCVSSDTSARCECSGTGYSGLTCEILKTATSATFNGQSYISYSLARKKISNEKDEVLFDFRTNNPVGLILCVGYQYDYIYAALNGGRLEIAVNLGSGEFREFIQSRRGQDGFVDNEWHKVRITRVATLITVRVDESLVAQGHTEGDFSVLSASNEFLVGGAADPATVPGYRQVAQNFRGNLRDVVYNGESFLLEILDLAEKGDSFIQTFGDIVFTTENVDAIAPITFMTEESFLLLPKWNAKTQGTLSFSFRTNEPNGVIMYNRGSDHITDFFALELTDGYLVMVLDLGGGALRQQAPSLPLNDGMWHNVNFERHHNRGNIQIDTLEPTSFNIPGASRHLNLEHHLVLGGIDIENDAEHLPIDLFSGVLRRGYVGCIKNLVLQGVSMDLPEYARDQSNVNGDNVGAFCREEEPQCSSAPCSHGGTCSEGWNRYICDCRITGYTGKTCDEEVARLSFNGNQYMRITVPVNSRSKIEDIFLRFRTRFPDGLLVATSSNNMIDVLMMELSNGEIHVTTNYGLGQTKITAGHSLDDNKWHAVHVRRQDDRLMVTVDQSDRAEVSENFHSGVLDYHYIMVGGLTGQENIDDPPKNFIGHMEQYLYNSQPFFDMARAQVLDNVVLNATFGERMSQRPIVNPFTFRTKEVFAQLETPDSYPSLTLFFHFKTTEPNGLFLFSEGGETDFISVGLVGGQVQYAFNMGAGSVKMHANTVHKLNDNKWHEVSISRDSRDRHVLQVDDVTSIARPSAKARHLDLTENLFVGGVGTRSYEHLPDDVEARVGFQGCFASLEINGRRKDLFDTALSIEHNKDDLTSGCEATGDLCASDVCANGGLCIPGWNSYSCDCRMTSYSGTNCSNVSISFEYGAGGGLISMGLPEAQWMRTDRDSFSVGVATRSTNTIIARIASATSDDYIEMELVNGFLWTMYNFGSADHSISDGAYRVNDGVYHVIKFSRTGANATLQIDQNPMVTMSPKGKQSTFFDDQAEIYIGGRGEDSERRRKRRRRRRRRRATEPPPFEGMMSGLSYNDMRVLDIAAKGDPRITTEGNVILVPNPSRVIYGTPLPTRSGQTDLPRPIPTRVTTTKKTPVIPPVNKPASTANTDLTSPTKIAMSIAPTSDGEYQTDDTDIIFVTGSRCIPDQDPECAPEEGGDVIFEPKIPMGTVSPTKAAPSTTPALGPLTSVQPPSPPSTEPGSGCADDDEDCMTASGETIPSPTPNSNPFPFTTVSASRTKDTSDAIGTVGTTPRNEASKSNNGFDFLGEAGLVVGAVAAAAVVFILVILIIYKLKNRNEGSYQINESRNYDYEATRTSLLPQTAATNGTVPSKPKPTLPPEYASKEWYV